MVRDRAHHADAERLERSVEPERLLPEPRDLIRPDVAVLPDVPELLEVGVAFTLGGLDREGRVAALPAPPSIR